MLTKNKIIINELTIARVEISGTLFMRPAGDDVGKCMKCFPFSSKITPLAPPPPMQIHKFSINFPHPAKAPPPFMQTTLAQRQPH
jgi:hypothetical protein